MSLFLLVLVLFVSPRAPSHSLSKHALSFFLRSVIADSYSSAGLSLLSLLRLLPLPLILVLPFVLMGFGVSWRLGHSFVTHLCLLYRRPLPGLLSLSSLLSISLTFNFLPLRVSVWVRWWLWVQWCNGLFLFLDRFI